MDELGLFPLGIVLLPTEHLPLHIFEDRYKELIGECLEGEGEFGLVYADDDGTARPGDASAGHRGAHASSKTGDSTSSSRGASGSVSPS